MAGSGRKWMRVQLQREAYVHTRLFLGLLQAALTTHKFIGAFENQ